MFVKKKTFLIISINHLCFLTTLFFTFSIQAAVILVDPGHGGDDKGAQSVLWEKVGNKRIGKVVYEKDVALIMAKKIKNRLQKKYTTYLTRGLDRTVSLMERADLAEKIKADLFISVHLNSSESKSSYGFETYYLDNHQDVAVKKVEHVENQNSKMEDPIVQKILIDLAVERTVEKSKKLSNSIHQKMKSILSTKFHLHDRGNRPGLFFVLALSKRPGILIEAGFLSNPNELKKLTSNSFQENLAKAVADGVDLYFVQKKKRSLRVPKDVPLF